MTPADKFLAEVKALTSDPPKVPAPSRLRALSTEDLNRIADAFEYNEALGERVERLIAMVEAAIAMMKRCDDYLLPHHPVCTMRDKALAELDRIAAGGGGT
jgi:hypothetical protein